jgi:uncharacterized protein (DUF885 family)
MKAWIGITLTLTAAAAGAQLTDQQFEQLGNHYLYEAPALSPVAATFLGDHRFDAELDEISPLARARQADFLQRYLDQLARFDRQSLSPANQVDAALLENRLRSDLWRLQALQEFAWNPTLYTELSGGAVYGLMARDFAPLGERLGHVSDRLEQFPRFFRQIRETLDPERVPTVHAETAVQQNRGVLSALENLVVPHLVTLPAEQRQRLKAAIASARQTVEAHQVWLEEELLPAAGGDFRLGPELYDQKLAFTLESRLGRVEIRSRAESELQIARQEMYAIAQKIYLQEYPYTRLPSRPTEAYMQALIRGALEVVYRQRPQRGQIVETANRFLEDVTSFVAEKEIVSLPEDPVEVIVMPEFRRGVSLAYCDSPGPLDAGQKTFYAVSPLPEDWTPEQVRSFLREYNDMGIQVLTMHEATPGHYLQLAHSNRYPSTLRAVLSSGMFIEGWAVYTEGVMRRQGYLKNDPRFHLIVLKLRIRAIINAIIDQAIHAEGMTREAAMEMMIEQGFQEEREAAGKWIRAQLTSAQLSTYFVGYLEHSDLRREVERSRGAEFDLRRYHDEVLSFGSPPVRFVRALMLDLPIEP